MTKITALVAQPLDTAQAMSITLPAVPFGVAPPLADRVLAFAGNGEQPLYWANGGYVTAPGDSPANTAFEPVLLIAFNYEVGLFDGDEPAGRSRAGFGEIRAANGGGLDGVLDYGWDGRLIELFSGDKDADFATFARVFRGTSAAVEASLGEIVLRLRDRQEIFTLPVQSVLYAGTGGAEGLEDLANKPKPLAFGEVFNISPPQVDPANLVFQIHDGVIQGVDAVRDQGVALAFCGTDYADYAALVAATTGAPASGADIETGEYATALAAGLIRLAASPAGRLTVDARGDATGGYVSTTADIVQRIALRDLGAASDSLTTEDIDARSVSDVAAAQPAVVGYFTGTTPVPAGEILDALMRAIGGYWYFSLTGALTIARLTAPLATASLDASLTGPAFPFGTQPPLAARTITLSRGESVTYGAADLDGGTGLSRTGAIPSWRRRIGYKRNWTVQGPDDLAGGVSDADVALYGAAQRFAAATTATARVKHRRARDVEIPGYFRDQADAAAEATRQQGLFGVSRDIFRLRLQAGAFDHNLGDVFTLETPARLGLPKTLRAIGLAADSETAAPDMELWG